jgi:uncharacterized OsmC-like protein
MARKDDILAKRADFTANPEHARAQFSVESQLIEGLRCNTKVRQFNVTVDEPPTAGGTDAGPNPVELVLVALASCQEITYRLYAEHLGISLDFISIKLDANLDLRGLYGAGKNVRPGFQNVRGTIHLQSSASQVELTRLKQHVDAHCPVLNILTSAVPVSLELAPAALLAQVV